MKFAARQIHLRFLATIGVFAALQVLLSLVNVSSTPAEIIWSVTVVPAVLTTASLYSAEFKEERYLGPVLLVIAVVALVAGVPDLVVAPFQLTGALLMGGLLGDVLHDEPPLQIILVVAMGIVDVLSFQFGETHTIVTQSGPTLTSSISLIHYHVLGSTAPSAMGVIDMTALGFFCWLSLHFRRSARREWTWVALTVALMVATLATFLVSIGAVPLLPPLGLAFLCMNGDIMLRRLRSKVGSTKTERCPVCGERKLPGFEFCPDCMKAEHDRRDSLGPAFASFEDDMPEAGWNGGYDRRQGDRRRDDGSWDGVERRKGDRRRGSDRRGGR